MNICQQKTKINNIKTDLAQIRTDKSIEFIEKREFPHTNYAR